MYLEARLASERLFGKIAPAASCVMVSSSRFLNESRKASTKSSAGRLPVSRMR